VNPLGHPAPVAVLVYASNNLQDEYAQIPDLASCRRAKVYTNTAWHSIASRQAKRFMLILILIAVLTNSTYIHTYIQERILIHNPSTDLEL
jgi:hypothetical protein